MYTIEPEVTIQAPYVFRFDDYEKAKNAAMELAKKHKVDVEVKQVIARYTFELVEEIL